MVDAPFCAEAKRGKDGNAKLVACRAPYPGEALLAEAAGLIQVSKIRLGPM
jgi:hypothetical protein